MEGAVSHRPGPGPDLQLAHITHKPERNLNAPGSGSSARAATRGTSPSPSTTSTSASRLSEPASTAAGPTRIMRTDHKRGTPMDALDLVADLNARDDDGLGWSTLADAAVPERVRPGAMLLAGNRQSAIGNRQSASQSRGARRLHRRRRPGPLRDLARLGRQEPSPTRPHRRLIGRSVEPTTSQPHRAVCAS
jgi:hypothetical protein